LPATCADQEPRQPCADLVAAHVPWSAFVSSDGLASKPDNLHFDAASLREFGRRYAVAFAELTRSNAAREPRAAAPLAPASTSVASPAQLLRLTQKSSATHAERDYYLYLPAGYADDPQRRWPVMLFLHGDGSRVGKLQPAVEDRADRRLEVG